MKISSDWENNNGLLRRLGCIAAQHSDLRHGRERVEQGRGPDTFGSGRYPEFLGSLDVEITGVGFEAETHTQYLTYGLQSAGFDVVCMEARQVKAALSAMRNKTDKNDARGIAQVLRSGWYSRVHVKSLESHQIRTLLSSRKAVMSKCIDLENEIRGLFKVFGIKLLPRLGHGSFDAAVREMTRSSKWSSLEAWGMKHAKSRGHRRAVVAVARKLAFRRQRETAIDVTSLLLLLAPHAERMKIGLSLHQKHLLLQVLYQRRRAKQVPAIFPKSLEAGHT